MRNVTYFSSYSDLSLSLTIYIYLQNQIVGRLHSVALEKSSLMFFFVCIPLAICVSLSHSLLQVQMELWLCFPYLCWIVTFLCDFWSAAPPGTNNLNATILTPSLLCSQQGHDYYSQRIHITKWYNGFNERQTNKSSTAVSVCHCSWDSGGSWRLVFLPLSSSAPVQSSAVVMASIGSKAAGTHS